MQKTPDMDDNPVRGRRTTWVLSLVAAAPMVALAILLVSTDRGNAIFLPLLEAFKMVSALSLSFLGGIRWGILLRGQPLKPLVLAATLIPAIVGWASLLLSGPIAVGVLLLAVCGMGAWDSFYWHNSTTLHWYAKVRTIMTLLAALAHMAVLLKVL